MMSALVSINGSIPFVCSRPDSSHYHESAGTADASRMQGSEWAESVTCTHTYKRPSTAARHRKSHSRNHNDAHVSENSSTFKKDRDDYDA